MIILRVFISNTYRNGGILKKKKKILRIMYYNFYLRYIGKYLCVIAARTLFSE